ncbi:MAG TPA: PLP-dependent aminotransferase family protein [Limnochordia bacterium]
MIAWDSLYAERTRGMRASDIRDAFRLAERAEIISFAGGFPGPESFPNETVAELACEILSREPELALQYGPTEGFAELREYIAAELASQGMSVDPAGILVTNGSQQGLDLISKLFIDPGDEVIVELPGYVGGIGALLNYEARPVGIPVDRTGLDTDRLAELLAARRRQGRPLPKLAYVVPNFQNPTGATLSLQRRQALIELSREYGFLIVEDNPYGEIRFEGERLPTVKSLDPDGRVLYLGSYSKIFLPGFRLGWIAGDPRVIARLVVAKQATDLCSGSLVQRVVIECFRRGVFTRRREALVGLYRQKRDAMLAALQASFPGWIDWTRPSGGFFVWATLPPGADAAALLPAAVAEERVAYVAGRGFHVDGSGRNTLRLAYSQASTAQIEAGIERLGRFFERHLGPPLAAPMGKEVPEPSEKVSAGGHLAVP